MSDLSRFQSGDRIAERYIIARFLKAERSNHDVYKAWDHGSSSGRPCPVVVKTLAVGDQLSDRLQRERQLADHTEHSHLVHLLGFGDHTDYQDRQIPYVVYEWLPQGDLRNFVPRAHEEKSWAHQARRRAPQAWRRLMLRAVRDAARGIAHLHKRKIVHRDIKPENLFWCDDWVVKAGDYDIAKDTRRPTSGGRTAKGQGTQGHLAPEVLLYNLRERDDYDEFCADVWSLGVTLHLLLAGRFPFGEVDRDDPHDVERWSLLVQRGAPELKPAAIDRLSREMLAEEPGDRPGMEEIAGRLDSALDETPSPRRPAARHTGLNVPLVHIRRALTRKIQSALDFFAASPSPLAPRPDLKEESEWYATVLLRPPGRDGIPGDWFYHIYIACYRDNHRVAFDDWTWNRQLPGSPTSIRNCCSGLVIRWLDSDTARQWINRGVAQNDYCHFQVHSTSRRLEYLVLRKVKEARGLVDPSKPPPSAGELIYDNYATDHTRLAWPRGLNWRLKAERVAGQARPHEMSQEINAEIIVPIYDPSNPDHRDPDTVLGVANFEWVQDLSEGRTEAIGDQLVRWIHNERKFPISRFACDVLGILAEHPPSDEDWEYMDNLRKQQGVRPGSARVDA